MRSVEDRDGRDVDRRSGKDRREQPSAWVSPSVIITLASNLIWAVVIVVTMRAQISNAMEKIAELRGQVTTLQSLVQVTTAQQGKLDAYEDRIKKLENAVETQTKAYNYDFTTRLARVEAKNGIFKKGD